MKDQIESTNANIGRVESVANEICFVSGFSEVGLNNILEFSSGDRGLVFGFSQNLTQVVIIGNYRNIKKGDLVKISQEFFKINFSEKLLGRIINPLGDPLDDRSPIESEKSLYIDSPAKKVSERAQVAVQLQTGFLAIDSQIPVGLGQRELLIGDKKIGKSDLGIATIGHNRKIGSGLVSIYVAIDAQTTAVKRRITQLDSYDARGDAVVIVGRASDAAILNYLAPMTAVTIAEEFARRGRDVLVIFDNLTRHAKIYRQLSLLLKRSPGREAYPGDVFYLHARLLERCGKFSDTVGGGSITAMPVVETQGEEITDYITTNLMSITDGHILFSQSLANRGVRPAIDGSFSVTRIGGRVQLKLLRYLSDQLKGTIVRYNEVEKFAMFGTELQQETLDVIDLGKKITALFNQTSQETFNAFEQVVILDFVVSKKIMNYDLESIPTLRKQLLKFLAADKYKTLSNDIFKMEGIDEAMIKLDEVVSSFIASPDTIAQKEQKVVTKAEKETIIDVLNDKESFVSKPGKTETPAEKTEEPPQKSQPKQAEKTDEKKDDGGKDAVS
jgi:F-type H+-transporting ATPase subunit alpha